MNFLLLVIWICLQVCQLRIKFKTKYKSRNHTLMYNTIKVKKKYL